MARRSCLFFLLIICSTCVAATDNEFVVLLSKYSTRQQQESFFSENFGIKSDRLVPSKVYPSDFCVVSLLSEAEISNFVSAAKIHPHVRLVVPQQSHRIVTYGTSNSTHTNQNRRPSAAAHDDIVSLMHAQFVWDQGITGSGVRVAVLDTGLARNHPHFPNVVERIDWTDEMVEEDVIGHGTFVAGLIGGHGECRGLAPDAQLYIFRVFTSAKLTYTSWFLDAFNYALHKRIHILNLSIGGPDFNDQPFVDKVRELSANNVIIVSAIGNDGPLYGTLNNPADQPDVIGVGGVDLTDRLSFFSSRGMTTWEFPTGMGRVKPDVLAYANNIRGPSLSGGCRWMSGTSVASPVVAGAATLIASALLSSGRAAPTPASIKQILVESAEKIDSSYNIYEQGSGKLDLIEAIRLVSSFTPKLSAIPRNLDLTDCPYMWPYCKQPIFHGALPVIFNFTLLNSASSSSRIDSVTWTTNNQDNLLDVSFAFSDVIWPYSGWLSVHITARSNASKVNAIIEGTIVLSVTSRHQRMRLEIPVKVKVVPSPPRSRRVLWDQFHSLRYPGGYFPRDALWIKNEPFDWKADHLYTNFDDLFNSLRDAGYFVDIMGQPISCIDLLQYGTILIVDPEDEFYDEEVQAFQQAVNDLGLSAIIVADWYNNDIIKQLRFFDENTRQWWVPVTGGANVPALNNLLAPFGIAFGTRVYSGDFHLGSKSALFASGTSIVTFPSGGRLIRAELKEESPSDKIDFTPSILGLVQVNPHPNSTSGRLAVFGDSSCLDSSSRMDQKNCLWLMHDLLRWTSQALLPDWAAHVDETTTVFTNPVDQPPQRPVGNQLSRYSSVLNNPYGCRTVSIRPSSGAGVTLDTSPEQGETLHATASFFRESYLERANARASSAKDSWNWHYGWALLFLVALLIPAIEYRRRHPGVRSNFE